MVADCSVHLGEHGSTASARARILMVASNNSFVNVDEQVIVMMLNLRSNVPTGS